MRRIAFFGGSFDPPHRGHLAIARAAADRFALDEILFAPVGHQPLKAEHAVTPFVHRYAMTVLATQADPRFIPSLLDAPRESGPRQPNYTVDTLRHLRASLAESNNPTELFTLLGADSWLDIALWHQASRLLAMTDWIVAARPGFSLVTAERALPQQVIAKPSDNSSGRRLILHHADGSATAVMFLTDIQQDISATKLRDALEAHGADLDVLPSTVRDYIRKTGLYGVCHSEAREESR
jgi:nicotinate-nucleotide adenylyltransferase